MSRPSPNQLGGHYRHLGSDRWRLYAEGPRDPLRPRKRNTITRVVHVADAAAAASELARLQLELKDGKTVAAKPLTYADVFDRYLEHVERRKMLTPRVIHDRRGVTRRHVIPVIGKLPIAKITLDDLDRVYDKMLAKGLKASTLRTVHTPTRACFAFAKRRGWVDDNVAEHVELPPVPKPDPYAPELNVVRAIVAALSEITIEDARLRNEAEDLRLFLALKTVLGARKGELAALKYLDFDLEAGVCTIRRALSYVPGRPLFEKTTKEEDVRVLSIDNTVVALLRAQRARQAEICLALGARFDDKAYVFHKPGQPRTPVHLEDHNRRFARLRSRVLEIGGEPVTLRSLRAFVATELIHDDTDVVDVAARLGNTPGTIYKYYAAKRPARDKDVMAKMRRKLGG